MEHRLLVELVKQYPQIWDRNSPFFRDKELKEKAWTEVAVKTNASVDLCKDAFKSLREKYLREREKAQNQGDYYKPWELFDDLRFLDPHILTRASVWNGSTKSEEEILPDHNEADPTGFDKKLIYFVKRASPIWDRNSNTYPNKTSKHQLWENIASSLNRDINCCMLRWKALREKYIRQKIKFQDGEAKWELLDSLNFLDKVIQYRRKQSDLKMDYGDCMPAPSLTPYQERAYAQIKYNFDTDDTSFTDSSNDFLHAVKEENIVQQVADSSYNSFSCKKTRERSASANSEAPSDKKVRRDEEQATTSRNNEVKKSETVEKSPEQLFGDLVASLLCKKPESQRNLYMIEIMTVLSK
ncbi:uncharacterized protein LOC115880351 [Sitophilus oryzae]|uniref:Uncharacterized protein LOC115880351 n=1 Tax=Sitophilus oryzae TaxID=7048 RepID=A0A6J2XS15_SITOR|nr:uncharacterized protein LOC115880351 [Sitophilus oryzae]